MARKFALLIVWMVAALTGVEVAGKPQAYTVETVPNAHVADSRQYVSDPARLLSAAARDTINALFAQLEAATGIETAVVMLPSIGEADLFGFSQDLFRHWGIGKKKSNNGLLILFVEDQHRIRFHTGYGIEGFLTDAKSKRIQTRYMLPAFRRGDWSTGMVSGSRAVCSVLKDSMRPEKKSDGGIPDVYNYLFLILAVLSVLFFAGLLNRRARKCPHCGKSTLSPMSVDYYRGANGHRFKKEVSVCSHCGHVVVRNKDLGDGDGGGSGMGSFLGGLFIGSLLSGGRGGSFGGGDSGGGGSESGW